MAKTKIELLLKQIRACTECGEFLPLGPRPILRAGSSAKILVVGQAPGIRVHRTGIPWNDPSGERLRGWLGMNKETFYDETLTGIIPMGFCYPGTGNSGDLPPRKECAPLWHSKLAAQMPQIKLTLLIGRYAQAYYLREKAKKTVTETVRAWKTYGPEIFALPHPSPRNNIWLKKNPWFEASVLPELRAQVRKALNV